MTHREDDSLGQAHASRAIASGWKETNKENSTQVNVPNSQTRRGDTHPLIKAEKRSNHE
jgi:hypothetical protein